MGDEASLLKKLQRVSLCQTCHTVLDLKRPLICSRCKNATYCSKDCQIQHWSKQHKKDCNERVKLNEKLAQLNVAGEMEYLDDWKRRSRVVLHGVARSALSDAQYRQQPPDVVTVLTVDYNFNLLSFVPVEEPTVTRLTDLPDISGTSTADLIRERYETILQSKETSTDSDWKEAKIHFLLITYKETASLMPLNLIEQKRRPWSDSILLLQTLKVKSHKVDPWSVQRQATLKAQLEGMQSSNITLWTNFIHFAFRLHSQKPCHLKNAVVVYFDFDLALGRVARLTEFKLVTLDEIRRHVQSEMGAAVDLSGLEVVNCPKLLDSRDQRPHNIKLAVVFCNKPAEGLFISPQLVERNPNDVLIYSPKTCDKKASLLFKELQKFVFPPVPPTDLE